MQRSRVAAREDASEYEYLKEEVNRRLLDRLEDVYAHQFESVLEMGSGSGETTMSILRDREDVKTVIQVDPSFKMLQRGAANENGAPSGTWTLIFRPQTKMVSHSPSLPLTAPYSPLF